MTEKGIEIIAEEERTLTDDEAREMYSELQEEVGWQPTTSLVCVSLLLFQNSLFKTLKVLIFFSQSFITISSLEAWEYIINYTTIFFIAYTFFSNDSECLKKEVLLIFLL